MKDYFRTIWALPMVAGLMALSVAGMIIFAMQSSKEENETEETTEE